MRSSSSFDWSAVVGVSLVVFLAALIFYPVHLVNPVRQPITRVSGELRSLATAVFDYHDLVKSASSEVARYSEMVDPFGSEEFRFGRANEIWPNLFEFVKNEHLGAWPDDPFDPEEGTYRAAVLGATFVLISLGDDGVLNTEAHVLERAIRDGTVARKARILWSYSPTNGSGSPGDVFRVSY